MAKDEFIFKTSREITLNQQLMKDVKISLQSIKVQAASQRISEVKKEKEKKEINKYVKMM